MVLIYSRGRAREARVQDVFVFATFTRLNTNRGTIDLPAGAQADLAGPPHR